MNNYLNKVDFNTNLFLLEMKSQGFHISFIGSTPIASSKKDGIRELTYDVFSSGYTFAQAWLLNDKYLTKKYFAEYSIPVLAGKTFSFRSIDSAITYAKQLGFPVVAKPVNKGQGEQVYTNIQTASELKSCINQMSDYYASTGMLLIERYFQGQEYRVFVSRNDFYAVVNRVPAEIVGNGVDSIASLINQENERRMNPRTNCLCTIKIDSVVVSNLKKQGLGLSSVLKNYFRVRLRENSNVSSGGNCIDVTEKTHKSFVELGKELLKNIGLPYLGFDLLCENISKPLSSQKHFICECNVSPGLSLHMLPAEGKSRNVARAILDSNQLHDEIFTKIS